MLTEDQYQLIGSGRNLLMGAATRFEMQEGFNPFQTGVRAPQAADRPYAHGSLVGAEWQDPRVVPIHVIASGADGDMRSTREAIQAMTAAFSAVGATGEIAELHFRLKGDDEFVLFGRPRGVDSNLTTMSSGYVYASTAFVANDPRIYSSAQTTLSTGLPLQQGGLILPAVPASTRLRLPDQSGAYASTPNHASLQITGDLSLRIDVFLRSWADGVQQLIARYGSAGAISYSLSVDATGFPRLQWSVDGTAVLTATCSVAFAADAGRVRLRADIDVDNGASGRSIRFYTAPSLSGSWSQLGSTVTQAGVTSILAGTAPLEIGSRTNGTVQTIRGTVNAAEVRNSAGTTVAAPDFTNRTVGAPSFTDSTAKLWTINGTARLVGGAAHRGGLTLPTTVPGRLLGGFLDLVNDGTAPSGITIRIDGPAPEPRFMLLRPDGSVQVVRFLGSLTAGQWLEIDSVQRTALLNGLPGANQRGASIWDLDQYPLLPGSTRLRFLASAYDPAAQLTATYRSAWW